MIQWLATQGLQPAVKPINEAFEFGGGEVVHATRAFIYPIMMNGHLIEMDVAEVERCPPLLSSQAMRSLGLEMSYHAGTVTLHACSHQMPLVESP